MKKFLWTMVLIQFFIIIVLSLFCYFILHFDFKLEQIIPQEPAVLDLNACVEQYRQEYARFNFVYGELMIGFKDKKMITRAQDFFANLGLVVTDEGMIDWWDFSTADVGFLLIKIPPGEEFYWKCVLEHNEQILGVNLNHIVSH